MDHLLARFASAGSMFSVVSISPSSSSSSESSLDDPLVVCLTCTTDFFCVVDTAEIPQGAASGSPCPCNFEEPKMVEKIQQDIIICKVVVIGR